MRVNRCIIKCNPTVFRKIPDMQFLMLGSDDEMNIRESAENYLETILIIQERKGSVRSIDIANELNFSKPSVSVAMKNLRENGYISVDDNGFITLTDSGFEIADRMYERHRTISQYFMLLGVDPDTAVKDACRIEHIISIDSFEAIKREYGKLKNENGEQP